MSHRTPAIAVQQSMPARHAILATALARKRIEEPFGWMKTVGGLRKTRHRGRGLVEWFFVLAAAAYNLIRIPKILAAMA
jgi:Transposase DDE domain